MKYHKALEAIARRPTALQGVICNRTKTWPPLEFGPARRPPAAAYEATR